MNRFALSDPLDEARTAISRRILFVATAVFALGALLMATSAFPIPHRAGLVTSFALAALLSLLATRSRGEATQWAALGVTVAALALVALYAGLSGLGLNAPAIGFMTLLPMAICAAVGMRAGVVTAVASVASLLALAWAEYRGLIGGAGLLADLGLERRLANHMLLLGAGLACGAMVAQVLLLHRRASAEREARFVGLLGIAVDTYWELNATLSGTTVWRRDKDNRFVRQEEALPAPWDQAGGQFEASELAAHKADLMAHRPFRNLHTRWLMPDGSIRHDQVSGEPRFDAQGCFAGYWGVTRDITADVQMQKAMHATESRYRDLFELSPLALVIHRDWQVADANAAALALFGYPDVAAMAGQDLLHHLGSPDQRGLARERLRAVEQGARLAPVIYHTITRDGRRLMLRATAARLDDETHPGVLSIFDDVTELHEAQEGLRRSETTLSHLVATSPDLITLTDLESGQYVMVNDTFTRFTGYSREQAIGRTALELGIWSDPKQRAAFVEALRSHG
ncbi:MAG TPA: PAS domain-containing protein, partial [Burkholderiaceae bacterium]